MPRAALGATIAFIVISGLGMALSWHGLGHRYATPGAMPALLGLELVLLSLTLWLVRRYGPIANGLGRRLDRKTAWVLLPSFVLIALMAQTILAALIADPSGLPGLALIGLVVALVGWNEELVFRGFVLRTLLPRYGMTSAVLGSALGFSLIHAVNVLAGLDLASMLVQLVLTFLFGVWAALVVLRIGALWPMMLFHAAWDFCVIGGPALAADVGGPSSLHIAWTLLTVPPLWIWLKRRPPAA